MSVQDLQREYGRCGRVRFIDDPSLGAACVLRAGETMMMVALKGGLVSRIRVPVVGQVRTQRRVRDILWMSGCPPASPAKPWRGGIPVCWPWFGAHPVEASAPSHGFVRTMPWKVVSTRGEAGLSGLILVPDRSAWPEADWARSFKGCEVLLRLSVSEGSATVCLETTNQGEEAVTVSQALHSYMRVADISDASVTGFDRATYIDALDGWRRKQQDGAIRFSGEVDRIYLHEEGRAPKASHVREQAGGAGASEIELVSSGSGSSVVWNPWIEKSERLGDMNLNESRPGYREMVCVETANAAEDAVLIAPGECHALQVTFRAKAI